MGSEGNCQKVWDKLTLQSTMMQDNIIDCVTATAVVLLILLVLLLLQLMLLAADVAMVGGDTAVAVVHCIIALAKATIKHNAR